MVDPPTTTVTTDAGAPRPLLLAAVPLPVPLHLHPHALGDASSHGPHRALRARVTAALAPSNRPHAVNEL